MAHKHGSDSENASAKTNGATPTNGSGRTPLKLGKNDNSVYNNELRRLQIELVKLQEWIRHKGLKLVALFEGRDAAGKGGAIKRITECLNRRVCRVVALSTPTEREKTQWYFQRYGAASARRRRDGPVRPQLVQPRRRRARHGFLQRKRVSRIPAQLPRVRAHAGALGHHPAQVLVFGKR